MCVFKQSAFSLFLMILFLLIINSHLHAAEETTIEEQETYVFYTAIHSPTREILRGRLEEAFRRIGLKMELVPAVSAQRSLILANEEGDGDANRVSNIKEIAPKNTTNLLQIPEPILNDAFVVYSNKLEFHVDGWESLKGYRNGARYGVKIVEKNLPEQRIFATTTNQLLKMLATDRLDTVVDWGLITTKGIRDLNLTAVVKQLSPPLKVIPTYAYIHKKHKALVPRLVQALSRMKEDGTFDKIESDILNPPGEKQEYVFYTGLSSPMKDIVAGQLQEAFRRIGKRFKLTFTGSAERALLTANEEGDGDALRVVNIKEISPELTRNLMQIPEPVVTTEFTVYTRGKIIPVAGWESLKGYRNGFRSGVKILEKNIPGKRTALPDSERLFQMLDQGRLDTVIEHNIIADWIIKEKRLSDIKKAAPPLMKIELFSYIHKKHRVLIPQIVKALIEMKADGTFKKIKEDVLLKNPVP